MDRELFVNFFSCHRADDAVELGLGFFVSEVVDIRLLHPANYARFEDPEWVIGVDQVGFVVNDGDLWLVG